MANIVNVTRQRVKKYLREIYGKNYKNLVEEIDKSFVIRRGSATVHVSVKPLSKDDCIVNALSYVVQGAKIGPKLLGLLMRRNATYPIGAYGLLFDDTVVFSHSIAGANLDANELRTTIATVAFVADETDDEIRKISGGLRAVDATGLLEGDGAPKKKPATRKRTAKKSATRKSATRKSATRKSATKKAARKTAAKKVPVRKGAAKKAAAKKSAARKSPAKQAVKKAAAKKRAKKK